MSAYSQKRPSRFALWPPIGTTVSVSTRLVGRCTTMPVIGSQSGHIELLDTGDGVPILCVHGSFSGAGAWRPIEKTLCPPYRVIAPNLWGVGGTSDWPPDAGPTIQMQAELVHHVIEYVGEPVHLVGHSHGGVVALATALEWSTKVKSMTLLDPLPANVLIAADEIEQYQRLRRFYDQYIRDFEGGNKRAGAEVVDFWTGAGTFNSLPDKFKEHIIDTTPLNLKDWQANWAYEPDAGVLCASLVPTLIVWGAAGNPIGSTIARSLEALMETALVVELQDASHMMISTHSERVSDLKADHVQNAMNPS